jgi:hypothetical protein
MFDSKEVSFNNDVDNIRSQAERLQLYAISLSRAESSRSRKSLLNTIENIVADISAYCGDIRSEIAS